MLFIGRRTLVAQSLPATKRYIINEELEGFAQKGYVKKRTA